MAENNLPKTFSEVNEDLMGSRFDSSDNSLNSQTVYLTYDNQFQVQQTSSSPYVLPVTILNNENNYLFYNNGIDTDLDQLQNKETVPQYIVNLDGSSKIPTSVSPTINTVLLPNVDRLQEMYSRFPLLNKLIVKRIYTRNLLSIDKAIQELDKLHKLEENKRKNIRLVYKQPKKETPQISRTSGDENLKYLVLSSKPFERMSTNLYKKVVIHDNNVFDCNVKSEPTIIEDFIKVRCKAFVSDEINGIIQEDPKGVVIKTESIAFKVKNEKITSSSDAGSIYPWRNKFVDDKSSENSNNTQFESSNYLYPIYKGIESDICDIDCEIVKPTGFLNDLGVPDALENEQPTPKPELSDEPKFFRTKRLGDLELKKRTYVTKELSQIRSDKKPIISENYRKRKKIVEDEESNLKKGSIHNAIKNEDTCKKACPGVKTKHKDMITSEEKDLLLNFFNQCSISEISLMPGSSLKIAEKVCSLAPFLNIVDLSSKIKNANIVADNFIENCQEVLNIRNMFSKLMFKCEKAVAKIENIIGKQLPTSHLELSRQEIESSNMISENPKSINQNLKLKPFQLVGVNWLNLLHKEKVNGILADESGLGKTVQTISFLAHLYELGNRGPHLVIVPNSSMSIWEAELKLWCPHMKVIIYHGSQDERKQIRIKIYDGQNADFNVLLTTYNISTGTMEDRAMMKRVNFHYGIFDEANMMKNMLSNRYKNLINFKVKRRLLLTGPPFQNSLLELVSLLSFVMPDLFLPHSDFLKKIFQMTNKRKDESGNSNIISEFESGKIEQAKHLLKLFSLRRLKSDITPQLSAKSVETVSLSLTPYQQTLYTNVISELRQRVSDSQFNANIQMVMDLRRLSNHPLLVRNYYTDETLHSISTDLLKDKGHESAIPDTIFDDLSSMNDFQIHITCQLYSHAIGKYSLGEQILVQSNKFQYLDKYLPEIISNDHRVVIFTQFVMMLDVLEAYMNLNKYLYLRLDDQLPVSDQKELIDRFNKDEAIKIFILSSKAGNIDYNLRGADVVIIYDLHFNPLNDQLIENCCHRLGQRKDVRVIKLISKDTIEDSILSMANSRLAEGTCMPSLDTVIDEPTVGTAGDQHQDPYEATSGSPIKYKVAKSRKVQFQMSDSRSRPGLSSDRSSDVRACCIQDLEQLIQLVLV